MDVRKLEGALATMGPADSDAATLASDLSRDVRLFDTFREALGLACVSNTAALVPCGYVSRSNGGIDEMWVDLNFEFSDRLKVTRCFSRRTRPMCLATNGLRSTPETLVVHPATVALATRFAADKRLHFVTNKPEAARRCAEGEFDMCIASLDTVKRYSTLRVTSTFTPEMVWVVYARLDAAS